MKIVTKSTESTKSTDTIRLSVNNIKRITSLAGKLQMESGDQKSLDDAIDCLFDCWEKREKKSES